MSCQICEQRKDAIRRAIQELGAPVMDYSPEYAVGEYDEKIKKAVNSLLEGLNL